MKDEVDEFEDLKEATLSKTREEIVDKALIQAVKTIAEISRAQTLKIYTNHPKITQNHH